MSGRDTIKFWRPVLVFLSLGLPLHGQCGVGPERCLRNPDASESVRNSLRDSAVDPAVTPDPRGTPENSSFSDTTVSDNFSVGHAIDSAGLCAHTMRHDTLPDSQQPNSRCRGGQSEIADPDHNAGADSKPSSVAVVQSQNQAELDRDVYYRNKWEFAFDGGWLPINIPFVFDVFLGDAYNKTPLNYSLVPLVASLRWHIDDVGGPWIFRGNWDMTVSGSITVIPRGPETRYFSYDMGIRRNFVPRRGKVAPYFDGRAGLGEIDAKEPLGVLFAQGQNFTFTINLGSGVRYNFNPRYSVSAGLNWMHISNLYLSQPAFSNYGINVYGPMFGINIRLGKPRHASE